MKKIIISCFIITIAFMQFGCKKNALPDYPLKDFFDKYGAQKEVYTIDPSIDNNINTEKYKTLFIPKNSFIDNKGDLVKRNVRIEFTDIRTLSEMVLSNKPAMSNGKPLVSGGEFNIQAFAGYHELQLKPGNKIIIYNPSAYPSPSLQGYSGTYNETDGTVNWTEDFENIQYMYSTTGTAYPEVSGTICKLNWVNWDHPYSSDSTTQLNITTDESFNTSNTKAFIVIKSDNVVVGCLQINSGHWGYEFNPINKDCYLLFISEKGDKYYYGYKEYNIHLPSSYNVDLIETSDASIVSIIKKIDNP